MANQEHLDILKQGVDVWNKWREEHPGIKPDLGEADIRGASLQGVNFEGTRLFMANLIGADLQGADLQGAQLQGAQLQEAQLQEAQLQEAWLYGAVLLETNLEYANLTGCLIHGISAWNVKLEGAIQSDLVITHPLIRKQKITVDNLEVAQFIYLLLDNQKIRQVINTITSKVVLILGRFTDERKPVLDALRDELRTYNYSPVVFDFDPSAKRDLTETVSILAHMSHFVIADLTDAKSIPQELQAIVPHLPSVPVQPILQAGMKEYAMFEHYESYPWVLPVYRYRDISSLLTSIKEHIIKPVEERVSEKDKTKELEEENRKLKERIKELEQRK